MNKIVSVCVGIGTGEDASKSFELILPNGANVITTAKNKINCRKGDIIIIPPLVKYRYGGGENDIKITVEQAILPFRDICVIGDDKNGGIAYAVKQAAEYFKGGHRNDAVISALGNLIAAYIAANSESDGVSPAAAAVREDILTHVSDVSYSLEDSLKKLPLNYDYLRKLFKKETGLTPHEFLLRERMELARGLILGGISNQYSPYSVSQIAEACGFSEPLYFSRVFKKYFGVSPSEYGKN